VSPVYQELFFKVIISIPQYNLYAEVILIAMHGRERGSDNVHTIIQDSKGYIWVGTEGGLCRFDGENFLTYAHSPDDSGSLWRSSIWCILEDREGFIWAGGMGLNRLNPHTGKVKNYSRSLQDSTSVPDNIIRAILQDRDGEIWIGTYRGLGRWDRETDTWKRYHPDPGRAWNYGDMRVGVLFEDRDGTLWAGTGAWLEEGGGLYTFDKSSERFTLYPHSPRHKTEWVSSIYQDSFGRLWVAYAGLGQFQLDPTTGVFTKVDVIEKTLRWALSATQVAEDRYGGLWLATWGTGLLRYSHNKNTIVQYSVDTAVPAKLESSTVTCLLADRSGVLWAGTQGSGVQKVTVKPFVITDRIGSSPPLRGSTNALLRSRGGNIYISSESSGILNVSESTGRSRRIPLQMTSNVLAGDRSGSIFIGAFRTVFRLTEGSNSPAPEWSIPGDAAYLTALHEDQRKRLWIAPNRWKNCGARN